jgi:hypothetical protein
MILGLLLALASALATNVAFLFKHRGAVLAPPILVRHLLRSAVGLFRSRSAARLAGAADRGRRHDLCDGCRAREGVDPPPCPSAR